MKNIELEIKKINEYLKIYNMKKEKIEQNVEDLKLDIDKIEDEKEQNYLKWQDNEITEEQYFENMKWCITTECKLKQDIKNEKDNLLNAKKEIIKIKDNQWIDTLMKYKNQKKISKAMLNDLIEKIYINDTGRKIKIIYKYQDAYLYAMNYLKMVKKGGNINA